MSRIFEALQRSEFNGAGFEFPTAASLATEVLRAAEKETSDLSASDSGQFPSLPVSVAPNSRLICLTESESIGAEKFRFLGVRLRQLQQARPMKKLLITSTIPEEGKSMVCANLAVTLARKKQQKILLLEGDLRRPVLAARFGLHKLAGLSEWFQGEAGAITNIYHLEGPGLWFLPAGQPPENPTELIQSARLSELMNQLAAWFDWIVIDSPPVLPLADTSVWMRLADGVLLVAREGKTEKQELERGVRVLEQSNLLGVVLNSCTSAHNGNNYYYYKHHSVVPSPAKGNGKAEPQSPLEP